MSKGQRSAGKAVADRPSYQPALGDRLRALRTARSLSLAEVAEMTDVSKSFLALVESGRTDISIGRLLRLADFYGVSCVDLLPNVDASMPTIVRRDQRQTVDLSEESTTTELLASNSAGGLTGLLAEFAPGGEAKEFRRHTGPEVLFVISGELTLEFADGRATELASGDSACFEAGQPHRYRNSGEELLRFIAVSFGDSVLRGNPEIELPSEDS